MSKVMQVYGMSIDEALRLSEAQVDFMLESLEAAATELLKNDTEFLKSLSEKVAPVSRAVREELEGGWVFEQSETGGAEPDDQSGYVAEPERSDPAQADAASPKPSQANRPDKPIGKPPKV